MRERRSARSKERRAARRSLGAGNSAALVDATVSAPGSVDILINNAGIDPPFAGDRVFARLTGSSCSRSTSRASSSSASSPVVA